jgi:hypothetical protein
MHFTQLSADAHEKPEVFGKQFIQLTYEMTEPRTMERQQFEEREEHVSFSEALSGRAGTDLMREATRNRVLASIHEGCLDVIAALDSDEEETASLTARKQANQLYQTISDRLDEHLRKLAEESSRAKREGRLKAVKVLKDLRDIFEVNVHGKPRL